MKYQQATPKSKLTLLALAITSVLASTITIATFAPLNVYAAESSQTATQHQISIAAGKLSDVLAQFAASVGVPLSFQPKALANINSNGLQGSYTVKSGFSALLAGTGYELISKGNGSYSIQKTKVVGTLALTTVGAASANTTEGTGSYTTQSMSTATKLALSIRETPQAVTVLTRQRMDDEGIIDLVDVVEKTPGLTISYYGVGRPYIYSRGFSIETINEDGITNAFNSYIPSPLSNLSMYDRVEIVRGSAGLSQGAGNPSAAINLMRKRPTDEFQASIKVTAGSWSDYSTTADISGGLNDEGNVRGRVVAYIQDGENFRDIEKEDSQMFYATLDYDLSANTKINIGYSYLNTFTNMVWGGIPVSSTGKHLDAPRSTFVGGDWEHLEQEVSTVYASVEHTFNNDWSLRLNSKYSDSFSDLLGTWLRPDGLDTGFSHGYWAGQNDLEGYGIDLFLSGTVHLFDRDHELVFGGTTISEESDVVEFYGSRTGLLSTGIDPLNFDPRLLPSPPALDDTHPGLNPSEISLSQDSIYSSIRLNLTDAVKLIVGTRIDWYEKMNKWSETKENGHVTLYGGVIYDLHKSHSLYASYTDIFTPQDDIDMNKNTLESVLGQNYELGIKGEYFDNKLNASIAIFRIDQTNLAKEIADQTLCATYSENKTCHEAAGLVRNDGIDIELQGELSQNWQIGTGYTYSSAEYVKDANVNNIGERLDTGIPEHLFKVNTTYQLSDKWRVGGGITYQSEVYYDIALDSSTVKNSQDAYSLVNFMVAYEPIDKLTIQLNVNNVFDKNYYSTIADDVYWGAFEMYGEPRNFMLSVQYAL